MYRYDGAGNDFFIADARTGGVPMGVRERADLARAICRRDRSEGGADGLLVLDETENPSADVALRIYNADGSEAEMCGNGARCAVVHVLRGPAHLAKDHVVFDTYAGLVRGDILLTPAADGASNKDAAATDADAAETDFTVRIDLGTPEFHWAALGAHAPERNGAVLPESSLRPLIVHACGREYEIYGASLGNPHVAVFVPDVRHVDVAAVGREIEHHELFTRGTNVHFVALAEGDRLIVRHWERGSGATQACGTGAVASAAIAVRRGLVQSPVTVDVPGGRLRVEWRGGAARLIGPVRAHGEAVFA